MSALELALMSALIAQSIDIARLDAGERGKVFAMLDRLQSDLTTLMGSRVLSEMGRAQTSALLKEVTALIQETYTEVQLDIAATLSGLAPVQADATAGAIEGVLNITLGSSSVPSATYLETLASNVLIDGSPVKAWFERQAGDVAFRFAGELRKGLVAGETNQQIISRVVGTKDVPGIMPIARKNAAALVQTSVATVAQEAKNATYAKNADIIKGTAWLSTLDGHTCEVCANLDGQQWYLDGAAMPGTTMPFSSPPSHWNCRCVAVPVLKPMSEISGGVLPDIPLTGSRASVDGPVPRGTTFADWFANRTYEQQVDQFGKGKVDLYREGKITLRDMLDFSGRPLTLDQLKAQIKR